MSKVAIRLDDPAWRRQVYMDLDGSGGKVALASEIIRGIIATELHRDPSSRLGYRQVATILSRLGRAEAADICLAGSLLNVIPPEFVDLSKNRTANVDQAAADPSEGVRRIVIHIAQQTTPFVRSRSFDGSCPPTMEARPQRERRPHFVAILAGGRCIANNVAYGVFTRMGTYLTDFCRNDGRLIGASDPAHWPRAAHLPGTAVCLTHAYSNGNFHWMMETLPRFFLLRSAGVDPAQADHIVTRPLQPYQIEALVRLGVDPSRLRFTPDFAHVTADRLVVTSNVEHYDYSTHPPSIEMEPWVAHFVNSAFGFPPVPPERAVRRVHISRKKATWRSIVNQDDVTAFLNANGFVTVDFEDMTLEEKHQTLNGAEMVVGLFGAGFTHLPFCRPGAKAVLIYPQGVETDAYWVLAQHAGLEHYHFVCEDIRHFFPLSQKNRVFITRDVLVNLDHLARALRLAGAEDVADP